MRLPKSLSSKSFSSTIGGLSSGGLSSMSFLLLLGLLGSMVGCSTTEPYNAASQSEKTSIVATATPSSSDRNTTPETAPSTPSQDQPVGAETAPVVKEPVVTAPLKATTKITNDPANNPTKNKEDQKPSPKSSPKPISDRALLFSCPTENGKEILLYQTDTTIDYSFGRPDEKPELELQVQRDQASTWQWKGIGRSMTYSVNIPNGDVIYSIFWSVDRLSEHRDVEAGVQVERDGKNLATVNCIGKVVSNLQGVQLKPTQY